MRGHIHNGLHTSGLMPHQKDALPQDHAGMGGKWKEHDGMVLRHPVINGQWRDKTVEAHPGKADDRETIKGGGVHGDALRR